MKKMKNKIMMNIIKEIKINYMKLIKVLIVVQTVQ